MFREVERTLPHAEVRRTPVGRVLVGRNVPRRGDQAVAREENLARLRHEFPKPQDAPLACGGEVERAPRGVGARPPFPQQRRKRRATRGGGRRAEPLQLGDHRLRHRRLQCVRRRIGKAGGNIHPPRILPHPVLLDFTCCGSRTESFRRSDGPAASLPQQRRERRFPEDDHRNQNSLHQTSFIPSLGAEHTKRRTPSSASGLV